MSELVSEKESTESAKPLTAEELQAVVGGVNFEDLGTVGDSATNADGSDPSSPDPDPMPNPPSLPTGFTTPQSSAPAPG